MRQIHQIKSLLNSLGCFVFLLGFTQACVQYEPLITDNDYKIQIVDENNKPVPSVTVTLFRSEQDLRANENPLAEFKDLKTDSKGMVNLKTIALTSIEGFPITYYISAEYGLKTNWDNSSSMLLRDGMFKPENDNTIIVPIKESMTSFIAGRKSKRWKLMAYRVNGAPLQSCEYQTTWEFLRGTSQVNIYNRGQGCGTEGASRGVNIWTIDDKNGTFTLNAAPMTVPTVPAAKFSLLNDKKMTFSFTQVGINVEYAYEIE